MFCLVKKDDRKNSKTFGMFLHLYTDEENFFQKAVDSVVENVTIVSRGYGSGLPYGTVAVVDFHDRNHTVVGYIALTHVLEE